MRIYRGAGCNLPGWRWATITKVALDRLSRSLHSDVCDSDGLRDAAIHSTISGSGGRRDRATSNLLAQLSTPTRPHFNLNLTMISDEAMLCPHVRQDMWHLPLDVLSRVEDGGKAVECTTHSTQNRIASARAGTRPGSRARRPLVWARALRSRFFGLLPAAK